ncbi:MAG: sulfotransferase [Gammaproteobacteria bacterium]|nr:sulfotransferase [Gammaproteobacteria bacterium]
MSAAEAQRRVAEALRFDRAGQVQEAISAYRAIVARWPQLADVWYRLAALERRAGNFEAALAAYERALAENLRRPEEACLNRAVILAEDLRDYAGAERELGRALALKPDYAPALLNLGNLHEDLGQRQAAIAAYERILASDPVHPAALARRVSIEHPASPDDPWIDRLRAAIARPGTAPDARATLGFALGLALDACGAYPEAFAAYSAANRDSRAAAPPGTPSYDREAQERYVDRLIAAFPALPVSGSAAPRPPGAPQPIFVCGMFRSGSTLTERLLARAAQVASGGELEFLPRLVAERLAPYPESLRHWSPEALAGLAAGYLEGLARVAPRASFVVDKRPDNFLHLGLVRTLFPAAPIVHTVRDPLDNCLSIFFLHLDQGLSYALDLEDIGHYYRQYRRLMAHWKALCGPRIIEFDYDRFVAEPAARGRELFEALGLSWSEDFLQAHRGEAPVRTASVWQVREPIYTRSSGRARHYAAQLAGLRAWLAG